MGRAFLTLFQLWCVFGVVAMMATAGQPRWQVIDQLTPARSHHASVMLVDGAVLIAGGITTGGATTSSTQLLDASGGQLRTMPSLSGSRASMASVVVHRAGGSDVYVIGGYTGTTGNYRSIATVERFSYSSTTRDGQWTSLGSLDLAVGDCRAVFDGTSSIIVTGGRQQAGGALGSGTPVNRSWRINITTGAIQRLPDLTLPHAEHAALRYLDQLGRYGVLTAGGEQPPPTTVTELFINGAWDARANAPRQWRASTAATTDRADIARVFGGSNTASQATAECEWYDVKSGWRAAPRMSVPRTRHAATNVSGPTDTASAVLVVGGFGATTQLASTELFTLPGSSDPVGGWEPLPLLGAGVEATAVSLSAWNLPAVSGGASASGPRTDVWMLQPLRANDVVMPSTEVSALSDSVFLDVTNTWVLPVRVDTVFTVGTSEFLVVGATSGGEVISAGAVKRYRIYFRPSQEGLRQGAIVLRMGPVADTIQIEGIGLRSTVAVTTSAIDMGDVIVGQAKDTCLPLIINNGTDTLRVDSLRLSDPTVTVVSPLGRFKVAPGDTMTVCLRYRPQARVTLGATMTVHIGARQLPVAVIGRGIRRFVVFEQRATCDTITAVAGDVVTVSAIMTNPSDRTVTVTNITVTSTTAGTVVLDPSVTFPFDVQPNTSVPIPLRQTIVREGREDIVLTSVDNGDSVARGSICTVPRSRNVQLGSSVIDLGTVCAGAVVITTVRLENVSSIETIQIDSAVVTGLVGTTDLPTPTVLQPRSSVDVNVQLVIPISGPLDGRLSFDGPSGSTVAVITGTIAPSVEVALQDARMSVGTIGRQAVRATTNASTSMSVGVEYSWRLLSARAVIAGDVPVATLTGASTTSGLYAVDATFARAPVDGEVLFFIEYDVLRADALEATILTAATPTAPCVVPDTATIEIDPFCGSSNGFVYFTDQPTMIAQPLDGRVTLRILNTDADGELTVHAIHGAMLHREDVDASVVHLDLPLHHGPVFLTFTGRNGTLLRTFVLQP